MGKEGEAGNKMTTYQLDNGRHFKLCKIQEMIYKSKLELVSKATGPLFILLPLPTPHSVYLLSLPPGQLSFTIKVTLKVTSSGKLFRTPTPG